MEFDHTNVVYFIASNVRPNMVKIGMTMHLAGRIKEIARSLKKVMRVNKKILVYPLAVISTRDPGFVEGQIHLALNQYRITGEWFYQRAVIDYLYQLKKKGV